MSQLWFRQAVAMLQPSILSTLPAAPSLSRPASLTTCRSVRRLRATPAPTLFDQHDHDAKAEAHGGQGDG